MSRDGEQSRVIVSLFLILFVGVADNQVVSPLLPAIRADFGKSPSEAGLLFTGYSVCAGLFVLLWGPLSDAFGRKQGLLNGLVLFLAGSSVSFLAGSYPALMTGRMVTGIGAGMLSLNAIAYAADYFPYAKRGWAMQLHIGAQRNELECHLANLSCMYEQQAQGNLARLHSLLMPIMLIIVAAIMTLCIVALLMPLMSLINSVQG